MRHLSLLSGAFLLLQLFPHGSGQAVVVTCAKDPCLNDGTCVENAGVFEKCVCTSDWDGKFCQVANGCETPSPCKNGGTCKTGANGGWYCSCPAGFNGALCESQPCNPDPCLHGGTCVTHSSKGRTCKCPPEYIGEDCEIVNECFTTTPCQNNGTCCQDISGDLHCECPITHMGQFCEEPVSCEPQCMANGGKCIKYQPGSKEYCVLNATSTCQCPIDRIGKYCQADNPCYPDNPCPNDAHCHPVLTPWDTATVATYTCVCRIMRRGGVVDPNCGTWYHGRCCIYGDPWYVTMDNQHYANHDSCRQFVLKTCSNSWPVSIIPTFQIWVENIKPRQDGPSMVNKIGFDIYGHEIYVSLSEGLKVTYPNKTTASPSLPWPQDGSLLASNFPLTIGFDGLNPRGCIVIQYRPSNSPLDTLTIKICVNSLCMYASHNLSERVKGKGMLCGMCGNFDSHASNDYSGKAMDQYLARPLTPPGCFAGTTMSAKRRRRDAVTGEVVKPTCKDDDEKKAAEEKCRMINDEDGPFGGCYKTNPVRTKMFQACVFDVCYNETFLEANLAMYASVCSQYGKTKPWREEAGFEFKCPKGMKYNHCSHRMCMPSCENTDPCPDESWKDRCDEGCECPTGTIWDPVSSRCVKPSMCNKTDFGVPSGYEGPVPGPWNVSEAESLPEAPPVFQCCQKEQFNLTNQITCQFNRHCFLEGTEVIIGRCSKVCTCKSCGRMKCKALKKPKTKGCKHYRKCIKCYTQACFNDEEEVDGDDVDCSPYTFYNALKKQKTKCAAKDKKAEEEEEDLE